MAVGWLFYWGLITNLIGLAALLALLPVLDRFARAPTVRGAASACGAILLLYFAHHAMMLLFAGAAFGLAALYPWSRRATALRLVPTVFCAVIAWAQSRWQLRFMSPAVMAMPRLWSPLGKKLSDIPNMISPASDPLVLGGMSALCAATIAALLWLRTRERRSLLSANPEATAFARARSALITYRWELFASACLIAAYS